MNRNVQTHIFQSVRSFVSGHRAAAQQIESLKERLGTAVMLIGAARQALDQDLVGRAQAYLDLAERRARGDS